MRNSICTIALVAIMSIGASTPLPNLQASAQQLPDPKAGLENAFREGNINVKPLTQENIPIVAGNFLKAFLQIVALGSLLGVIYGGAIWMQARGNDQEVQRGKDAVKYSIIGLVVALSAYMMVSFIGGELEKGVTNAVPSGQGAP